MLECHLVQPCPLVSMPLHSREPIYNCAGLSLLHSSLFHPCIIYYMPRFYQGEAAIRRGSTRTRVSSRRRLPSNQQTVESKNKRKKKHKKTADAISKNSLPPKSQIHPIKPHLHLLPHPPPFLLRPSYSYRQHPQFPPVTPVKPRLFKFFKSSQLTLSPKLSFRVHYARTLELPLHLSSEKFIRGRGSSKSYIIS